FFGESSVQPPSATFLATDTATQGGWKVAYGADGYNVIGNAASYPAYAAVAPSGQQSWTWAASTADPRALQKATPGATDRVAACWFGASFSVDVNLTDGQAHRVALYAVDWDSRGRSERVDVVDPTSGAVLDSRTLSGFAGGEYLVWSMRGHVQLRVTLLAG